MPNEVGANDLFARKTDAFYRYHQSLNDARLTDAREAIRAGMLINGGAASVVMAFAGSLHGNVPSPAFLAGALVLFAIGVALAAVAFFLAYLANYASAERRGLQIIRNELPMEDEKPLPGAEKWRAMAVAAVLSSYGCFVVGSTCAAGVILHG